MKTIKLSDIKIHKDFLESKTNYGKVLNAVNYIRKHGRIDKPIVLNHGVLVDNYARYLAASSQKLSEVPYVELQQMNYIIGKFDYNNKEYTWKNDRCIDIEVGDRVLVKIKNKDKKIKNVYVTVVGIFSSDSLDLYNKHKSVVKKVVNNC